jgi:hypothetical protein
LPTGLVVRLIDRSQLATARGTDSGLFGQATVFFAIALAGQRRFQSALFSWRNIEGVPFDFTDNVFLLYLAFEPAERAFQRLVIAEFDFCQLLFTCLSIIEIECLAPSSPDNTYLYRWDAIRAIAEA